LLLSQVEPIDPPAASREVAPWGDVEPIG
jgi:hypothetical protein